MLRGIFKASFKSAFSSLRLVRLRCLRTQLHGVSASCRMKTTLPLTAQSCACRCGQGHSRQPVGARCARVQCQPRQPRVWPCHRGLAWRRPAEAGLLVQAANVAAKDPRGTRLGRCGGQERPQGPHMDLTGNPPGNPAAQQEAM